MPWRKARLDLGLQRITYLSSSEEREKGPNSFSVDGLLFGWITVSSFLIKSKKAWAPLRNITWYNTFHLFTLALAYLLSLVYTWYGCDRHGAWTGLVPLFNHVFITDFLCSAFTTDNFLISCLCALKWCSESIMWWDAGWGWRAWSVSIVKATTAKYRCNFKSIFSIQHSFQSLMVFFTIPFHLWQPPTADVDLDGLSKCSPCQTCRCRG